jgi:hypothetical protein
MKLCFIRIIMAQNLVFVGGVYMYSEHSRLEPCSGRSVLGAGSAAVLGPRMALCRSVCLLLVLV